MKWCRHLATLPHQNGVAVFQQAAIMMMDLGLRTSQRIRPFQSASRTAASKCRSSNKRIPWDLSVVEESACFWAAFNNGLTHLDVDSLALTVFLIGPPVDRRTAMEGGL
jgi:hypothetical protein